MRSEHVLYDAETDMLYVEVRSWPGSLDEVSEQAGGEEVEPDFVIHFAPDGRPFAYEVEHASLRPDLVGRALSELRAAKGFAA